MSIDISARATLFYPPSDEADETGRRLLIDFLRKRFKCRLASALADKPRDQSFSVKVCPPPDNDRLGLHAKLGREGYAIKADHDSLTIFGVTPRSRLYGVCALIRQADANKLGRSHLSINSSPRFNIRHWESMSFQSNMQLPLGGAFDRPIEELIAVTKRMISQGPRHGINGFHLTGRGGWEGGTDMDWLISYRRQTGQYCRQYYRTDRGRQVRREAFREIGRYCHAHGMDFVVWDHEIILPAPNTRLSEVLRDKMEKEGIGCGLLRDFLYNKWAECFEEIPEIDVVNLTLSEVSGGIQLLHRPDIATGNPKVLANAAAQVRQLIEIVWKACVDWRKGLQVRSYNMTPHQQAVMRMALKDLPPDIVLMTKYTAVDFRGVEIEDNPLLGAFPGQPQVVEFTLAPECSGFGYIPAILADFYRARLRKAGQKGLAGTVARLDYHVHFSHRNFFTEGPPVTTFDTPNEFNIVAFSACAWNPDADLDKLWKHWAAGRYGAALAPTAEKTLRRTSAISQGIFYVKGFYLMSHLDQPPSLPIVDDLFKENGNNYRMNYFGRDKKLRLAWETLLHPDDRGIAACLAEKKNTIRLCRQALKELTSRRAQPGDRNGKELIGGFEISAVAAGMFMHVAELYLRLRQARDRKLAGSPALAFLKPYIRGLLDFALVAERRIGARWPLYHAARGNNIHEFPWQVIEDRSRLPQAALVALEKVWLNLLRPLQTRSPFNQMDSFVMELPDTIEQVALGGDDISVRTADGIDEIIPGPATVVTPVILERGDRCLLRLCAKDGKVRVVKCDL